MSAAPLSTLPSERRTYSDAQDPANFAPNFSSAMEPYGEPFAPLLDAIMSATRPGCSVLDVAGGYGRYALPLADAGRDVTVIDIHEPSLRELRRRTSVGADRPGTIRSRLVDVIREDHYHCAQKFDAVVCAGFLHHLREDAFRWVVQTMGADVSEGGHLIFEYSINKNRRRPDGSPIFVGSAPEHNRTRASALPLIDSAIASMGLISTISDHSLTITTHDFVYTADVLIVDAYRPSSAT